MLSYRVCFILNQASSFEWNQLHVQLFNYFAFLCVFGSFEAVFEWNQLLNYFVVVYLCI